ncbi:MAG: ABC transporter permease [Acidobacteria bacterium]|nr:MAG: ABC transporter permease [Acidobacteriota bacterium]MCE7956318.1 ABC transporter permease [Acidobacteria bacterium ACB2]
MRQRFLPGGGHATTGENLGMRKVEAPTLTIEPSTGWVGIDVGEIWRYRELLAIFAWRDVKVRYSQTVLGALWVWGQPLVAMAIFTFVFSYIARIPSQGDMPYSLFVFSGLLPWTFFAASVQSAGNSLVGNASLLSKVYFPRVLIPMAAVAVAGVDLGVTCLLLGAMALWFSVVPGVSLVALPVVVAIAAALSLGIGLFFAALNVEYRDVRVVVPFVVQIWMYGTPVVYPQSALPERVRSLVALNPMTGVVEAFRASTLGLPLPWAELAISAAWAVTLLISGMLYFRRMERRFADLV